MANERLRLAIVKAGLNGTELAQRVQVDPKTVERWITKGRLPRPMQRAATAEALGADELYLWPEVADSPQARTARQAELVRLYTHRGEIPSGYWYELINDAKKHIDILVISGLFLPDGHTDLGKMLAAKAREGVQVRYLFGDPYIHLKKPKDSAVLRRGEEEGVGDHLASRAVFALSYLKEAFGVPGVRINLHNTTLYNSIYRFDDDVLVNTHAYGAPAGDSPILHLRRVPGGRLFEHYMTSFDRVWEDSEPAPKPITRRKARS